MRELFPATPPILWQPRVSAAYEVAHGTVLHAGVGVFSDIIPAQIADLAATNAPFAPTFVGGLGGQVGGVAMAPGVPGSAADAARNADLRLSRRSLRARRRARIRGEQAGVRAGRRI